MSIQRKTPNNRQFLKLLKFLKILKRVEGDRLRWMRRQPSTKSHYFRKQNSHSSSDFASLSHLLPQEKADVGVHSPIGDEVII